MRDTIFEFGKIINYSPKIIIKIKFMKIKNIYSLKTEIIKKKIEKNKRSNTNHN